MKNSVEVNIRGLKCDAPGCDYKDTEVLVEDYPAYVGKPCPLCGASLLTQEDLDSVLFLLAGVQELNQYISPVEDDVPLVIVPLKMDGTGDIQIAEV